MIQGKEHFQWMKKALEVGKQALESREVPVGCIYVHNNEIIAKGFNQTNITLSGIRHSEFEALKQIIARFPHDYRQVLKNTDLYVTVEPCIMCGSMLRQMGIRRVFFGCANDRFGGNGSVLSVHSDVKSNVKNENNKKGKSCCELPTYVSIPGLYNKEAVMLLRSFYLLENETSPNKRDKKDRKLENDNFPIIEYNKYCTRLQFTDVFGTELAYIYDNNEFFDVNVFDNLPNDDDDHSIKRVKI